MLGLGMMRFAGVSEWRSLIREHGRWPIHKAMVPIWGRWSVGMAPQEIRRIEAWRRRFYLGFVLFIALPLTARTLWIWWTLRRAWF